MTIKILEALLLGAVAGAIDAVPMIKTAPRFATLLVFSQWVFLGLVIPFVAWDLEPWVKGMILGVLGMIPTMILVWPRNPKRIPGIAVFGAGLGAMIGFVGYYIA